MTDFAIQSNAAKEKELGVRIADVDYSNVDSLRKSLEEQNVDTVIAAFDRQSSPDVEIALIQAADASSTTRRFIPNWWSLDYSPA